MRPRAAAVKCGDLVASANVSTAPISLDDAMGAAMNVVSANLGAEPTKKKVLLLLGDAGMNAVQFSESDVNGWLFAESKGAIRTMVCMARRPVAAAQSACAAVLATLRALELPPDPEPSLPELNGKPLAIPGGCRFKAGKEISCGLTTLAWSQALTAPPDQSDVVIARGVAGTDAPPIVINCAVAGNPTRCFRITKRNDAGLVSSEFLLGSYAAPGVWQMFICVGTEDPVKAMPPVCAQVFSIAK